MNNLYNHFNQALTNFSCSNRKVKVSKDEFPKWYKNVLGS